MADNLDGFEVLGACKLILPSLECCIALGFEVSCRETIESQVNCILDLLVCDKHIYAISRRWKAVFARPYLVSVCSRHCTSTTVGMLVLPGMHVLTSHYHGINWAGL